MPSKSQPRQHSTSKAVKEKALSPRASLSLRDKIRPDISNRPPRSNGNHLQEKAGKNGNKKDELVKHMSSLPGYLQQGENPQDKILNFGVLDWSRLEKWKHKQKPSSGHSRVGASYAGSSSYTTSSIASGTSKTEVLPKQDYAFCSKVYSPEQVNYSPEFLHHSSKVISCHDFTTTEKCSMDEQQRERRKGKSYLGGTMKKSHKTKAPDSYQRDCSETGMPSSKCNELESDLAYQRNHQKQDSVILLLPKDFTQSGGLDKSQCTSVDGNSAELNWSSFSDVFSIEERHIEELSSDYPHSCPLPFMVDTETELDMNLDRLILDQRMHLPSDQPKLSAQRSRKLSVSFEVQHEGDKKEELTSPAASTTPKELDRKSCHLGNSNAKDPSLARQFSLSIGRLSRSLSFREGSTLPHLTHGTTRSGPAQALNFHDNPTDNAAAISTDRGIISPFKKLLHPILKHRAAKPVNSYMSQMENLRIRSEKSGSTVIKAVLQLTLKSGLPLFKFLVETNNEILASTVKKLSPLRKNDPSWLYSFYSVQEVKRKGGVWRHQGSKGKGSEFSYNIIGQMKVSETLPCENEEKLTMESVLYGVDLSKVDEETSESAVKRELGAIVMKIPKEVSGDDQKKNDENNTAEIEVILPSAIHSVPNEGAPASLIHRWRTGGLCDCGGWDVGCKLQVLTNQDQDDPLQQHCTLFLQGAGKESRPVFRLVAHGEGIYIVEYESVTSSLQAFAISVAVLSNQMQPSVSDVNGLSGERKGHYRSKSCMVQGEGTRYATYPPHSPVSRA